MIFDEQKIVAGIHWQTDASKVGGPAGSSREVMVEETPTEGVVPVHPRQRTEAEVVEANGKAVKAVEKAARVVELKVVLAQSDRETPLQVRGGRVTRLEVAAQLSEEPGDQRI